MSGCMTHIYGVYCSVFAILCVEVPNMAAKNYNIHRRFVNKIMNEWSNKLTNAIYKIAKYLGHNDIKSVIYLGYIKYDSSLYFPL